ncbi:hypothetical protein [Aliiroseovarius subalbicans]|uniref:hypothetical protein n=1 Tax=Aliiroseovarius subalbicans TaxID=2925840 RepID=UPI001F55E144|nr:hypothetical protein [Aliiroseovarius subalbicans]MCI2400684.1 hypothetical protein [Aliiroseovarius subalbicans]
MTRIIVHAGFYKTATTSVQNYLAHNRAALTPWFDYYGPGDLHGAGATARQYGQKPFPWRLRAFRRDMRAFLTSIPDAQTIVISRENLTGAMPGHRDWRGRTITGFSQAPQLLRVVRQELVRRFGPEVQIEILFTIRGRSAWLRSVYGHLLRSIHLTETDQEFAAQFAEFPDLRKVARELGAQHIVTIESHADSPAGPAQALLDLAGAPVAAQAALPPARRENTGQPPELMAQFLELNRSGQPKTELKQIKTRLLSEAPTP